MGNFFSAVMSEVKKQYITPDELRRDSYALGAKVLKDGFKPDVMVALWRGGAPIGCFIHELLKWKGLNTDHVAIRTSRYTGIDTVGEGVKVHSTSYVCDKLKPGDSVLLVDDVWDSGTTIVAFYDTLEKNLGFNLSLIDIRVATVYYKAKRNQTALTPKYYIHDSTEWLVFPHELEGMTQDEVEKVMGKEIGDIVRDIPDVTK